MTRRQKTELHSRDTRTNLKGFHKRIMKAHADADMDAFVKEIPQQASPRHRRRAFVLTHASPHGGNCQMRSSAKSKATCREKVNQTKRQKDPPQPAPCFLPNHVAFSVLQQWKVALNMRRRHTIHINMSTRRSETFHGCEQSAMCEGTTNGVVGWLEVVR